MIERQKKAQQKQAKQYNKTVKFVPFNVSDTVFCRDHTLGMNTATEANSPKLSLPYDGPYTVVERPTDETAVIIRENDSERSKM